MKRLTQLLGHHELMLLIVLSTLCIVIGVANPAFLTLVNLFDVLKNCVTPGILAMGVLVVLISGSIDISFPAIAAFSMYVTCRLAQNIDLADHIVVLLFCSAAIGCLLGSMNAGLVHLFGLPALIVTLGTGSMIRGGLLAFVGTRIISNIPHSMVSFSRLSWLDVHGANGERSGLPPSVPLFLFLAIVTHLVLTRTTLGRGIYALGGAPESARRIGFNIARIQMFVYGFVGLLSGLAGILHASKMRNANPFDLAGLELTVIAAVVLGGASITGGRGSVPGTILGVALLVVLGNSLLLVGLPSEWHQVVTGLAILFSTGITAWRGRGLQSTAGPA